MRPYKQFVALLLGVVAGAAVAVPLPGDGTLQSLPGMDLKAQPRLAGTLVEDIATPFAFDIEANGPGASFLTYTLSGTLQSRVVRASDGTYDFYWRVTPDAAVPFRGTDWSGDPVEGIEGPPYTVGISVSSMTVSGFTAPALRADWLSDDLGGIPPMSAAAGDGNVLFAFGDDFVNPVNGELESVPRIGLLPNEESSFFFVDTDARAYAKTASFSMLSLAIGLFAGSSASYSTFAPAAVPEPQTYALMLAGLGLTLLAARRRRRA
jgi:hypothetical protein